MKFHMNFFLSHMCTLEKLIKVSLKIHLHTNVLFEDFAQDYEGKDPKITHQKNKGRAHILEKIHGTDAERVEFRIQCIVSELIELEQEGEDLIGWKDVQLCELEEGVDDGRGWAWCVDRHKADY
jgi:hypothetical protein